MTRRARPDRLTSPRAGHLRQLGWGLLLGLFVAACGPTPSPSPSATPDGQPGPVEGVARDGEFILMLRVAKARYASGEPITAEATLRYTGITGRTEAWGSGGGLTGFGLEQLDGVHKVGPAFQDDCAQHVLAPEIRTRFEKSGGFGADDPDAEWMRAFLMDPAFRLTAGRWRVFALADFYATPGQVVPGCGGQHFTLEASVVLEVGP